MAIKLKPFSQNDASVLFFLQTIPEIQAGMCNPEHPKRQSIEGMIEWLRTYDGFGYLIIDDLRVVGAVQLEGEYDEYEISIYIDPVYWRRGYATEALIALRQLHPSCIFKAEVFPDNEASRRLFTKLDYRLFFVDVQ